MYPSNSAITTMSMASQGPGIGSTRLYTTFGSATTMSSGFPQYGAAASGGSVFSSHVPPVNVPPVNVPPVTNTGMFPQNSVPSYQQQSQDLYRTRLQQQAASHLPFPMQKPVSSTVSGFSQNPQPAFGPATAPPQYTNQSYQGQVAPPQSSFYPSGSSAAIPNMSGHPARMVTGPRPTPTPQAAYPPVFRAQNAAPSGLPLYEQTIHTITNPNYNKNNVDQQYPSLQQSMNPSPPLIRGHQNSWTLSKNPSQHSPQTGITAPPNKDYLLQTRQMPSATGYGPSLPSAAQTGPAYSTGDYDEKQPHVCGVCHAPFRKPHYLRLHLKGSRKQLLTNCGKKVIQNAGFDLKNSLSQSLIETLCGTPFQPRLCHIIKGPGYQTYGFLFKVMSGGAFVERVEQGSAAESAGLKPHDKIIEVNGANVEHEKQEEILLRMRGLPNEMKVLVADKDTLYWFDRQGIKLSSSLPMVKHMATRQRSPGASLLYQNQVQHPSATLHQPFVASARPLIAQQPVEQQRPYMYPENNNLSCIGSAAETSIPPSPFEEPDDRKLLGQWYAQPATPKPDKPPPPSKTSESVPPVKSPPPKTSESVPPVKSPPKTSESVSPVIKDVQRSHNGLSAEAVETVLTDTISSTARPPLVDPVLQRPESPTAVMRAKIFEMIKKGTPLSTFNDPNKAVSNSAAVTKDVTTPVGLSSDINQLGPDNERETLISPPPQLNVNKAADQEASLQEQLLNSDNDSKDGIRLIHSDEDTMNTNKDGMQGPATEQTVIETQCPTISHPADFLLSQSLANQLEIDKNIKLSSLDIYPRSISEERDKDGETNASLAETSSSKANPVTAVCDPEPSHPNITIEKESEKPHSPKKNPSNVSASGIIPQTRPKTTESVPVIIPQTQPKTTEALPVIIPQTQPKTTKAASVIIPQTQPKTSEALPVIIPQTQPKTTEALPVNVKVGGKQKSSSGPKDNSKKLKVKFVQPSKKASGSESPSKKITMTWKKKMAAKAKAETALSTEDEPGAISTEDEPGPFVDSVAQATPTEEEDKKEVEQLSEEGDSPRKVAPNRPNFYGAIEGIEVGTVWMTRMDCCRDGIHRPSVAGIHGGAEGAYSVVLNGGYEDDIDSGDYFTYTGEGGRELRGKQDSPKSYLKNLRTVPQSKDQTLTRGNLALSKNVETGQPVRVIRGFKLASKFAPRRGYRYDGLYMVQKAWATTGASGFRVWKFALKRCENQAPPPWTVAEELSEERDSLIQQKDQVEEDVNKLKNRHQELSQELLHLRQQEQPGASTSDGKGNDEEKAGKAKVQKKKRTSSEAQLNEDGHESLKSKCGRGGGFGRGRGRGQGQRSRGQPKTPTKTRTIGSRGSPSGRNRSRGRGRGRGRGLKIVAPAQNMSWQDYLAMRKSTEEEVEDSSQPVVEVDVDEVIDTPYPDQVTESDNLTNEGSITTTNEGIIDNEAIADTSCSDSVDTNTSAGRENTVTQTEMLHTSKTLQADSLKTELATPSTSTEDVVEVKTEFPVIIYKREILDVSEQSVELHTNENLISKTENYTLSWVSFHGCKILLITSTDGDFLVMKELVFEVFRPRRPEKDQSGSHTQYQDLNKQKKIQHIYKTKEKRLSIMYKSIDSEIFNIVHQILIEKRVLHKMQQRLGVISLQDALRLYHFITIIEKSQCTDIGEMCVKPYDSQNYGPKKGEMELKYPINFNESCKPSKTSVERPKGGSVIHTGSLKQSPKKSDIKTAPGPVDVIDISSDEDSCQSDATLPYIDGVASADIAGRHVNDEVEMKSPDDKNKDSTNESSVNENLEPSVQTVVSQDDHLSLPDSEPAVIQSSSSAQRHVTEVLNTPALAEPSLHVAPQCLSTILLMDSMTKSNVAESIPQKAVTAVDANGLGASLNLDTAAQAEKDVDNAILVRDSSEEKEESDTQPNVAPSQPSVPVSQPSVSVSQPHITEINLTETVEPSVSGMVTTKSSETLTDVAVEDSASTCKDNNDKTKQDEPNSVEEIKTVEKPETSKSFESRFNGVKGFFDVMYDEDYDDIDDDDLTLIDLDGNEELLIEEGDRRIDEMVQKRIKATTVDEIDQVLTQALRFQRPMNNLRKAILDGCEKQILMQEKDEELEKLKRENEELRRFVDQHREYLDPMPECDRVPGSQEVPDAGEGDKS